MLDFIAGVVLAVWAANFVATLVQTEYDGSAINGIFTVVMGSILAIKSKAAKDSSKDDQEDAK